MIRRLREMFRTATYPALLPNADAATRRKVEAALAKAERVLAEHQRIERITAETDRVEHLIRKRRAGA
jgi:hypothetical protein